MQDRGELDTERPREDVQGNEEADEVAKKATHRRIKSRHSSAITISKDQCPPTKQISFETKILRQVESGKFNNIC